MRDDFSPRSLSRSSRSWRATPSWAKEEITPRHPECRRGVAAPTSTRQASVYIGAEVKPGDILVGKVTPKGESPMNPEEKLLPGDLRREGVGRARHVSIAPAAGRRGTIVEVRVFNRPWRRQDERALAIERQEIERLAKGRDDEKEILERSFAARPEGPAAGREGALRAEGLQCRPPRSPRPTCWASPPANGARWVVENEQKMADIEPWRSTSTKSVEALNARFENKVEKLQRGDELPPGVMKMVKVFVAVKRKLQSRATRWPAGTATRRHQPHHADGGHARISRTERRSTSC